MKYIFAITAVFLLMSTVYLLSNVTQSVLDTQIIKNYVENINFSNLVGMLNNSDETFVDKENDELILTFILSFQNMVFEDYGSFTVDKRQRLICL